MTPTSLTQLGRPAMLLALAAAGPAIGGGAALGLALAYSDWLAQGGLIALLVLILCGLIGCGLWVLPTHVLALVCGWSLGWPTGAAVALATASLAAPLGYAVAAKWVGDRVGDWFSRYPKAVLVFGAIQDAPLPRAAWLIGLLRLSPVVPYGATNVLAATARVRKAPFVWGTVLGLAPRIIAVAGLGAGLDELAAGRPAGPVWLTLGIAATVLVVVGLGYFAKQALQKATADQQASVSS